MSLLIRLLVTLITFFQAAWAFSEYQSADIYTDTSVLAYSEAMPIMQFIDNLEGPSPDKGDIAFTFNKVEVGANYGNWNLGFFARFDYLLEFSEDTLAVAYADANDQDFPTGRQLHVELKPNHIEARGFGVGYRFKLPKGISVFSRINYLTSDALTDGFLTGTLTEVSEDDYEGDLRLDYYYEEDLILDRPVETVSGAGYSVDIDVFWPISEKWSLSLGVQDAVSAIYWDDLTYTEASVTSNTVTLDENGQLNAVAFFSGIESNRDYTQSLPKKSELDVSYKINSWSYGQVGYSQIASYHALRVAWLAQVLGADISGGYQLQTQAYDMAVEHKYFRFAITTDSFDLDSAKLFGFSLGVNIPII